MSEHAPTRVVIVGGGIAAAELLLGLAELAGDRVTQTVISPSDQLTIPPFRPGQPFSVHARTTYPLRELTDRVGATLFADTVVAVEPGSQTVQLATGGSVEYDVLVLAMGAKPVNPYSQALTFRGDRAAAAFNGLLSDLEQGYTKSVAFVVPPGVTWPLPLYELALLTAREAKTMGVAPELMLITTERRPLDVFGPVGSEAVAGLLAHADVTFAGDTEVSEPEPGLYTTAGDRPLDVQRVVTIPILDGIAIPGVPADAHGFIPVDEHCAVRGMAHAYAAGDGAGTPVKQGGIACQQADAIAERIAQIAGAPVVPQPLQAVLRGRLLTGSLLRYISDHDAEGAPADQPVLFAAHRKVDGRYLSPWLAEMDGTSLAEHEDDQPTGDNLKVEIEVPTENA